MISFKEKIEKLREIIEQLAAELDDEKALEAVDLFPVWTVDKEYKTGDRIKYHGVLYRVLQDHTSSEYWLPPGATSLYAEVLPGQDGDIGEWVQPDSTNPYMAGDKVTHNGKTWISDIDNNIWEPGVYGWSEISN